MGTKDLLKMVSAAMLLGLPVQTVTAQRAETPVKRASSTRSAEIADGLADMTGTAPSVDVCTTGRPKLGSEDGIEKKIFMLYNVGTGQFLSQGGTYGTHATLRKVPYLLWLECDDSTSDNPTYYVATNAESSSTDYYFGQRQDPYTTENSYTDFYLENAKTAILFSKVENDANQNIYNIRVGSNGWQYITALPNGNTVDGEYRADDKVGFRWLTDAEPKAFPESAQWKLISLAEYYELFDQSPVSMVSPVDATFKLKDPEFRMYSSETDDWQTTNGVSSVIRFGDETMYRLHKDQGGSASSWTSTGYTDKSHQRDYGRRTYAYAKGKRGYEVYQDVTVSHPGWYLIRCNGMSSQNAISGEDKPLAHLFITLVSNGTATTHTSSVSLRSISQDDVHTLETTEDGCGIGVSFEDGTWQRQTQICIETVDGTEGGTEISSSNPATLRIGWRVDTGSTDVTSDEITAVDAFELLYAGPRRKPELILDEDGTDLKHITMAADAYTNNVLHLNRALNANVWNTLILPVSLNKQQVLNAFGADVKLAKLSAITKTTLNFVTAEADGDNDEMLTAFTPYIIKPSKTSMESEAYTVDRFYTTETQDKWLSTDYTETTDEDSRLQKTIAANHYVIPLVSLDRSTLTSTLKDYNETTGESTWELNASNAISQSGDPGTVTCTGTFAKTYEKNSSDVNEIISGRDNLNGAYFMYKGKLIQVPSGNDDNGNAYQYGIKGFRCWFRVSDATTSKTMNIDIDGITDQTTYISEVGDDSRFINRAAKPGVYNLNGQKLREGNSTEGLPKGIYVVEGRKVVKN